MMNNVKKVFLASAFLLVVIAQASWSQDMPETEETVTLALGVLDAQEYGRNYGRDGNMNQLDVSFTATADLNHRLSWQAFDIERNEMVILLNDEQIRTALTTPANRLGEVDGITILAADLNPGANILSFQVMGGDEVWGVTNLLAESIPANVPGEPATNVLLDAPDQAGLAFGGVVSTDFTFDFVPRGAFYNETIIISFDTFVAFGGINGFDVLLNGRRIKRIDNIRGQATFTAQSVSLDKSQLIEGQNVLTIRVTAPTAGSLIDAGFANLQIVAESVPLLDVSVTEISIQEASQSEIEVTATIENLGASVSPANTLTFFLSESDDMTNPSEVASTPLAPIAGGASQQVVQSIASRNVRRGGYLSACIGRLAEDVDATNDCSQALMLEGNGVTISPSIMLLLDD